MRVKEPWFLPYGHGGIKIMKSSKSLVLAAALSMCAFSTFADNPSHGSWWNDRMRYDRDADKYSAHELSLDLFATYSKQFQNFDDIFENTWHHGDFSGGVGMNYFLTRYFGVGVDTYFEPHGKMLDNVSGDFTLRAPIGNSGFAPYAIGGAGWRDQFDPRRGSRTDTVTWHAGVGIEYRFNPHVGIFTDLRYIWADKGSDTALARAGFRIGLK
jgi:hypothetical protein